MALNLTCCALLNTKLQVEVNVSSRRSKNCDEKVREVIRRAGVSSVITSPQISLQNGNWVKLICGASFEDVVDVRNLSLVYTLAGVDCIDCAAEASVVSAVNEGIQAAVSIFPIRKPWVMISVNDDQDLHFRKAEFDPDDCPVDCSRPCERVCPANAISQQGTLGVRKGGVMAERCYGCGRCFPVCPFDKIREITYIRDVNATVELLKRDNVDAIEIHTSGRRAEMFKELWTGLGDSVNNLRLVAVSLPDLGNSTISAMSSMYSIMEPSLHGFNLWQLDGRPMSGDIGRGATRETIAFAKSLVSARGRPKAGGTNAHTVRGLNNEGLFLTSRICDIGVEKTEDGTRSSRSLSSPPHALISGVAFGGYARKIVGRVLNSIQCEHGHALIENYPEHLVKALMEALALVGSVKSYGT